MCIRDRVEGHLRAMLRDVLCGYLDSDLKGVADDILLEAHPEPFMEEIQARDLRREAEPEPAAPPEPALRAEAEPALRDDPVAASRAEREQDTAELEAIAPEPEPVVYVPEPRPQPPQPSSQAQPQSQVPQQPQPVAVQPQLDGVTQSADWGFDDPEDYSAPV